MQGNDVNLYKTPSKLGLKILIAENQSIRNHRTVDINVRSARNLRHSRYFNRSCDTHDCIPPRHRQILFFSERMYKQDGKMQLAYSYRLHHDKEVTDSRPAIDTSQGDIHSPRAF